MEVCVMQWKCAQCDGSVRNVHQYMVHTSTVLQGCTSQRCISLGAHQYMVHTTTVPQGCTSQRCISLGAHQHMVHTTTVLQGCTSQRCISLGAHQHMVHTTATGVRSVQWAMLVGLCVRNQRTPAKKTQLRGVITF